MRIGNWIFEFFFYRLYFTSYIQRIIHLKVMKMAILKNTHFCLIRLYNNDRTIAETILE